MTIMRISIDAAKEVMARTMVGTGQFETKLGAGGVSGTEEVMRPANESDVISFKVGDKEFTNSVSQLTEAYDQERAEVLRLSDIQRAFGEQSLPTIADACLNNFDSLLRGVFG